MPRRHAHAIIQVYPEIADLLRVLGDALLPPAIRHRLEHRNERRGAGRNHSAIHRELDQPRIALARSAEECFTGKEEHHEVGRLGELVRVVLRRKRFNVGTHLTRVLVEERAALHVVGGFHGVEVRGERSLGVDHDGLPSGQVYQHIRSQSAPRVVHRLLFDKIAVLQHASQLDHAPELHLTPLAARLRGPQGAHQRCRFIRELVLRFTHQPQVLVQRGMANCAFLVELLQFFVDALQPFVHRLHQLVDRQPPRVEVCTGHLLVLAQRRLREIEEGLIVGLQRLGRERRERFAQRHGRGRGIGRTTMDADHDPAHHRSHDERERPNQYVGRHTATEDPASPPLTARSRAPRVHA